MDVLTMFLCIVATGNGKRRAVMETSKTHLTLLTVPSRAIAFRRFFHFDNLICTDLAAKATTNTIIRYFKILGFTAMFEKNPCYQDSGR